MVPPTQLGIMTALSQQHKASYYSDFGEGNREEGDIYGSLNQALLTEKGF